MSKLTLVVLVLVIGGVAVFFTFRFFGDRDEDEDEGARSTASAAATEPPAPVQPAGKELTYNFDQDEAEKIPAGFHSTLTGGGAKAAWIVQRDATAPSQPNVLGQTSRDQTDYRFPLAIADEGSFRDLSLSVKFKAVDGKVDRAAGLAFRLQDANNYYVVRANALDEPRYSVKSASTHARAMRLVATRTRYRCVCLESCRRSRRSRAASANSR